MIANVLHVIVFSLNTISLCYFGWHPQFVDMGQKWNWCHVLDELSQGLEEKNFYPDWIKKKNDDYTNYKKKMQEQQNELLPKDRL